MSGISFPEKIMYNIHPIIDTFFLKFDKHSVSSLFVHSRYNWNCF